MVALGNGMGYLVRLLAYSVCARRLVFVEGEEVSEWVEPKNAKRGVDYYLHFGFYGHGGKCVRLKSIAGTKRDPEWIFKDSAGNEYLHRKCDQLFSEPPK